MPSFKKSTQSVNTSQELANMIYSVKEKLTDKEFKDIMEKLSIKNKEEEDVKLYRFTYMKIRRPHLARINNNGYGYDISNADIRTKVVCINSDAETIKMFLENKKLFHLMPFNITKIENKHYYKLSLSNDTNLPNNSIQIDYFKNFFNDDSDNDDDSDDECCEWYTLKKEKGVHIIYKKLQALSIEPV